MFKELVRLSEVVEIQIGLKSTIKFIDANPQSLL